MQAGDLGEEFLDLDPVLVVFALELLAEELAVEVVVGWLGMSWLHEDNLELFFECGNLPLLHRQCLPQLTNLRQQMAIMPQYNLRLLFEFEDLPAFLLDLGVSGIGVWLVAVPGRG